MTAYYNEIDPQAAQWLRNLIAAGLIAPGDVDERSIKDVQPHELADYSQCHFFAGIGVWSHALRSAGWPDDRPVWTGSCPCQPFSAAGKGEGLDDPRHLWPDWFRLIRERGPVVVFGEQVAGPDGVAWLDLAQADLEEHSHTVGAVVTCSAGFGGPDIRQRLYWVADAEGRDGRRELEAEGARRGRPGSPGGGEVGGLADTRHAERRPRDCARGEGGQHLLRQQRKESAVELGERMPDGGMGDPLGAGLEGHAGHGDDGHEPGRIGAITTGPATAAGAARGAADSNGRLEGHGGLQRSGQYGLEPSDGCVGELDDRGRPGPLNGFWRAADWLFCTDGTWRPVEPGTFPLDSGTPARLGRVRGYGNALNAQAATEFIRAYLDVKRNIACTFPERSFGVAE